MSDKQQVSEEDLHSAIIADSSNSEERKSLLTPLEIEMCTKFYNRVFITFLSAPLIYTPIHIFCLYLSVISFCHCIYLLF